MIPMYVKRKPEMFSVIKLNDHNWSTLAHKCVTDGNFKLPTHALRQGWIS